MIPRDEGEESVLPSGAVTPLEIQPGDPLLRPRALHSPTSTALSQQKHKMPPSSFPDPAKSLRPSFHPALPESRAPSPDRAGSSAAARTPEPELQAHRWVLHPRRGHAALNSGLRSLKDRQLLVVGRADDLMNAEGDVLGQNDLGDDARKDLEKGLRKMSGDSQEGIGCVPVWVEDGLHTRALPFLSPCPPFFFR